MATTVSERPQSRRRVTPVLTPGGVLIGLFAGFIVMLGLMSHIIQWHHVLIIVLMVVLGGVGHHKLRHMSKPKRQEAVRPGLRPFEQPRPDLVTRMGGWSGQKVRSIPGATAELRDLITQFDWPYLRYVAGPTFVHGAVRFGGWCRDSAGPVTIRAMTRSVLGVKLWIPSVALVVAAGFTVMPRPSFNTTDLQHPGLPGGLLMWLVGAAAAFVLLALVARFTIPVSSDIDQEGGRVMNDDADNANNHGAEVPTSASDAEEGVERTNPNLGERAQWRESIQRRYREQKATEPTVELTPQERQDFGLRDTLTEQRPDADDPLGLGSIDADLAGLIGADLPPEPPVGSPHPSWDDDVVSTGSRPTEGDTSAAQWVAGASESEEEGDLPDQRSQSEEDPDIVTARRYWLSLWPSFATASVAFIIMLFSFFFRATASTGALAYILFISACVVMIGVPIVRQAGELGEYIRMKLRPDDREKLSKQAILKITGVCLAILATGLLVWELGLRPNDIWIVFHPILELFRWIILTWFDSMPNFTIGLFLVTVVQFGIAFVERRKRPLMVDRDKLSVPTGLIFQRGPSVRFEHITDFEPRQTLGLKWVTVTYNTPEMDQSVRNVFWVPIQFAKLIERRMAES